MRGAISLWLLTLDRLLAQRPRDTGEVEATRAGLLGALLRHRYLTEAEMADALRGSTHYAVADLTVDDETDATTDDLGMGPEASSRIMAGWADVARSADALLV